MTTATPNAPGPILKLVPSMGHRERALIAKRPVATCVKSALLGGFWQYLDQCLLDYLRSEVHGSKLWTAPTAEAPAKSMAIMVLTANTSLNEVWETPTGDTERSYSSDSERVDQTWGDRITDNMYHWVGAWLYSMVGPTTRDRGDEIREKVYESLRPLALCEWEWEQSRRMLTLGQIGYMPVKKVPWQSCQ